MSITNIPKWNRQVRFHQLATKLYFLAAPKGRTMEKNVTEQATPSLGRNLRRLRNERGWSMIEMGKVVGLTQSSLSKLENDLMSLSYAKLVEVAKRLECDVSELFRDDSPSTRDLGASARLSVDHKGDKPLVQWKNIRHRQLAVEVKDRLMIPTFAEITGDGKQPELDLGDFYGERFIYVLEGTVTVYTEFYEPFVLKAGDGVYFDIRMRHNLTAPKGKTAKCIVVTTSEDKKFMEMERELAARGFTNISEFEQFQRSSRVTGHKSQEDAEASKGI